MDYLLEHLDQLGTITILFALTLAWFHGDIVPGSVLREERKEKVALRTELDTINAKDRADKDDLRRRLDDAMRDRG